MDDEHKENIHKVTDTDINSSDTVRDERGSDDVLGGAEIGNESTSDSDEISFEEVNEEGEVDARTTIKKLRDKIKKLEGEKQEYLDLSQRTRADYVNYKKEVETNRSNDWKFASKRVISDIIPVLDSYDMAQANKEAWEMVDQNWRIGIEYIFSQLRSVLEKEGVMQFGKVGDTFDPILYETMEQIHVEEENEDGKIVKVLQNGYKMHDMVLRPARVHVGNFTKN